MVLGWGPLNDEENTVRLWVNGFTFSFSFAISTTQEGHQRLRAPTGVLHRSHLRCGLHFELARLPAVAAQDLEQNFVVAVLSHCGFAQG
jgi:hypothetical protein